MKNEIQYECKLDINVDEYVESTVRPFLMDVIYCWSKGASFSEVMQMTDIFEGSVIRSSRRLDEFLNQLRAAARAVGEVSLESKFAAASESLCRGIMFANSLYLQVVFLQAFVVWGAHEHKSSYLATIIPWWPLKMCYILATIDSISFSPSLLSFIHAVDLIYLTVDFIVYTQSW